MRNLKVTTTILAMAFLGFTSCNENKKEASNHDLHSEMLDNETSLNSESQIEINYNEISTPNDEGSSNVQNTQMGQVLSDYMTLKDALVATNKDDAAKAGKNLESTLNGFNVSSYSTEQQKELIDIISDAKEHAEHIAKSEIDHQREHFKALSNNIIDMVGIIGTETKLFQQFCPMYDKGSSWLSMSKDIKNPYYGSKMLACGRIEKEFN